MGIQRDEMIDLAIKTGVAFKKAEKESNGLVTKEARLLYINFQGYMGCLSDNDKDFVNTEIRRLNKTKQ